MVLMPPGRVLPAPAKRGADHHPRSSGIDTHARFVMSGVHIQERPDRGLLNEEWLAEGSGGGTGVASLGCYLFRGSPLQHSGVSKPPSGPISKMDLSSSRSGRWCYRRFDLRLGPRRASLARKAHAYEAYAFGGPATACSRCGWRGVRWFLFLGRTSGREALCAEVLPHSRRISVVRD